MVSNVKSKLDTSKPYGEVWGQVEGVVGARYSQGTKLFNAGGEEIHDYAPVVEPELPPVEPPVEPPVPEADPVPEVPVPEVDPAPAVEPPALPGIPAKKK